MIQYHILTFSQPPLSSDISCLPHAPVSAFCSPNSTPSCCRLTLFPAPRLTKLLSSLLTGRKEEAQLGSAPPPGATSQPCSLTLPTPTRCFLTCQPPWGSHGQRPNPWPLSWDCLRPPASVFCPLPHRGGMREVRVGLTSPVEPTQADGQNNHKQKQKQEHPQP